MESLVLAVVILCVSFGCACVSAQTSLSEADKQELLDAHNLFRSKVDPPATNMVRMVSSCMERKYSSASV